MHIAYDAAKDAANIAKHGVSLAGAADIEWDTAITVHDTRVPYGEDRMITLAYIGSRLHCVVHVTRAGTLRIISLRKANRREEQRYAKA